jgi:hypothetical protein
MSLSNPMGGRAPLEPAGRHADVAMPDRVSHWEPRRPADSGHDHHNRSLHGLGGIPAWRRGRWGSPTMMAGLTCGAR